jgi:tetratricopeptide (TPR) repeat protein
MKEIINLIKRMRPAEVKLLRYFYKAHAGDAKRAALFEALVKFKNCDNFDAIEIKMRQAIYAENKDCEKRLEKLKHRLKSDILNIILLQEPGDKARAETAVFESRRLILQGEVLLGRGLYSEASDILGKAFALAKKNELFTEQLLIDSLRSNYNICKSREHDLMHYNNKIHSASTLQQKLLLAKKVHDEIHVIASENDPEKFPHDCYKDSLHQIHDLWKETHASKIGYYYILASIKYFRALKEFKQSLELGFELLKLEAEEPEIFKTIYYTGVIHLELGRCYLHTGDSDTAIFHAAHALSSSGNDMKNRLFALEILYFAYISLKDVKKAHEICQQALMNSYLHENSSQSARWWYLKSAAEAKLNRTKDALASLRKCSENEKEMHLSLAALMLEAICRIENGDYEWLEYKTDTLKRFMLRNGKSASLSQNKRFLLFLRILKTLQKEGFDFKALFVQEKKNIELLTLAEAPYSWEAWGYEILRFDEWLNSKVISPQSISPASQFVA